MRKGLACKYNITIYSPKTSTHNHRRATKSSFFCSNKSSPAAVTPAERKNNDFAALRRLSPDGVELDGGGAHVRESFILRSAQQEEALHRIWYALKRWRLVSRRIVLFPTTACSSINRR
ncbi:unnamed protein product [Spirodela intermedia]|uniref:Uncharacterized protein n=1 Tax=Spirodela intermedia TaxID=51605 RepID=A0A7I8IGV3_SPIIN|nr:unnamed protein product [Spirodela intermedia]CAA6657110.1 unnamed protein product [Spirodela intermedia]